MGVRITISKVNPNAKISDTIIVMDTTGSMSDIIESVKQMSVDFVDESSKLSIDPKYAYVAFGDLRVPGDTIVIVVEPTSNINTIKEGIKNAPSNGGGGNSGESPYEALQKVIDEITFRANTVRTVLLITDEGADMSNITTGKILTQLLERNIVVNCITPDLHYYRTIARETGGIWREIRPGKNVTDVKVYYNTLMKEVAKKIAAQAEQILKIGFTKYLALPPGERVK